MIKQKIIILITGIIITLLLSSCGTESPQSEIWWTRADSLAVDSVLAQWRDTISGYNVIRNATYPCVMSVPLLTSDTAPRSTPIEQIIKIAHLQAFNYTVVERPLITQYTFGRKNDSILTKDTFCYVTYRDSSNPITTLQFDSIWTITFYPDTEIILHDTIITYRLNSYTKTYYSPLEAENNYNFQTIRYLQIKKDSAALNYRFKYLSGFGSYIPDNTLAPAISYIILSRQTGQRDTFRYSPRADNKGLLNLRDKDSVYTITTNEIINVQINLPSTNTEAVYAFVSQGMPLVPTKTYVPINANAGTSNISFAQNGLTHLYIEIIPASALFYPNAAWKTTIWALPVRVIP